MKPMLSDILTADPSCFFTETPVALFRRAVQCYPDKEAVRGFGGSMTYRQLEEHSNALAARLIHQEKLIPGELVAFSVGRSPEALVAILGIWKAGGAYVAIDPMCPPEHNRRCLEAGSVRVKIDRAYLEKALTENAGAPPVDRSEMGNLALIIFTSGSTGTPKGVRLLHSCVSASVSSFSALSLRSSDVFASFSSLVFIAALYDIAVSLCLGCTLCFVPEEIRRDIHRVADFYIRQQISVTFLPPHMACKYIELDEASPLRLLLVGSEPVRNLKPRSYDIINVYASSEACAVISHYRINDQRHNYPIGQLMPALRGYIAGEDGQQVPDGQVGELWLSGPQLFDGYLDLPEVNRERIVPNPFEANNSRYAKVFKTADMVRQVNGVLEYVCRKDNMYKIRGFRVEASGVELCLLRYPGIREACVVCFTDAGGTNILFGYFLADTRIDHHSLRAWMARELPHYAIPSGLVQMDRFPHTLSGKVDRRGFQPPKELNDHKQLEKLYF